MEIVRHLFVVEQYRSIYEGAMFEKLRETVKGLKFFIPIAKRARMKQVIQ